MESINFPKVAQLINATEGFELGQSESRAILSTTKVQMLQHILPSLELHQNKHSSMYVKTLFLT